MKGKGSGVHSGRHGAAVIPCVRAHWAVHGLSERKGRYRTSKKRRYLSVTLKQELLYSLEVCREIP